MKALLAGVLAVVIVGPAAPGVAQWTSLAENPSWFPYGDYPLGVGGQPSPSLASLGLTAYSGETFYNTPGYWPRGYASGTFANGKYYVCGGYGPYSLLQDPDDDPDEPAGERYWNNRQSGLDIYDPGTGTWSSSKYDGTGPVGLNEGNGGALPTVTQGSFPGSSQLLAYDCDGDGTEEIFLHSGYPNWEGPFYIYDPDVNSWSKGADALEWSEGYRAQYGGVAREVGGKIYCVSGFGWGPFYEINGQVYDIATNTWAMLGEDMLPGAVALLSAGTVVGSDIYLLGGDGGSRQILKYDTTTNTLVDTGHLLLTGVSSAAAVTWNGMVIVLGGATGTGYTDVTQIYNPTTGTVVYGKPLPVEMGRLAAAIPSSSGDTIYVGGAFGSMGEGALIYNNDLWCVEATWLVPEPGAAGLFGFGLLSLLAIRRRK